MKVFIIILIITVAVFVGLYFLGKRMEKKQEESDRKIAETKQPVTMLIIDKKRLKFKEAGLPQSVIDATPWYARRGKVPIVKAKIGPQIMNLIADERIFDDIPVKKQVRAMVSGIYIVEVKAAHGKLEKPVKKKGVWGRFLDKVRQVGHADAASSASRKK